MERFCEQCRENNGKKRARVPDLFGGYVEQLVMCDHGAAERMTPVGEGVAKLLLQLNPAARLIRTIILQHRGEANAITLAEIVNQVWPEPIRRERGWSDASTARAVKEHVSELVVLCRMQIASSRDIRHPGYYMIETEDELNRARAHTLQHCRAWLARLKVYDPKGTAIRELYGQEQFPVMPSGSQKAGVRSQEAP